MIIYIESQHFKRVNVQRR